ncbi:MAG: glycosyltransferase family 2 protein [Clostridia bacterium]|nr:glycosyltransferase family 2 protein [Clostridia bacterium]
MERILWICDLLLAVIGFLYISRTVYLVVGLFTTKKYAPARRQHRYAIVIAARNEEKVIGHLLDSIAAQDYPAELITTFVVADNCLDGTAQCAREHGAICYERRDPTRRTKGYALEFLFDCIRRDYGIERFEGYFVFDADNLLRYDFVSRMNDAFDSGAPIVTSYRNTKNFDSGWLCAGYALHWLRTSRLESCARSAFGVSTRLQGTGYLFASELVRNGWHYTSLTEDREFSSDAVVRGYPILYQHEAQFYDEQPTSLRIALRQRIRWAKGNLWAFTHFNRGLWRRMLSVRSWKEKYVSYDMMMTNFPVSLFTVFLKFCKAAVTVALFIAAAKYDAISYATFGTALFQILIFEHLGTIPMAWLVFFTERKRTPPMRWYKKLWYSLMFPIFGMIGDLATWIAAFRRVTWEPIPHHASIAIHEIEHHIPHGQCRQGKR